MIVFSQIASNIAFEILDFLAKYCCKFELYAAQSSKLIKQELNLDFCNHSSYLHGRHLYAISTNFRIPAQGSPLAKGLEFAENLQ